MITQSDNGKMVNLVTGSTVFLALGNDDDWTITVEDKTVLSPYVSEPLPPRFQGAFTARQPGQTTISAVGEPLCRKAQPPCGAPAVLFRVQVVVM
jgi:hypothetical protein